MRKSAQVKKYSNTVKAGIGKPAAKSLAIVFADEEVEEKVRKARVSVEKRSGRVLRSKEDVDAPTIELLATEGATQDEIASYLCVSADVVRRHFAEAYKKGMHGLRKSLRRKQVELALKGDRTMLIWLGKNLLGQRDNLDMSNKDGTLAGAWAAAIGAFDKLKESK